ncbi:MAG: hypothetical protein WBP26_06090 [Candidatus Saccharimonadales bacterium]
MRTPGLSAEIITSQQADMFSAALGQVYNDGTELAGRLEPLDAPAVLVLLRQWYILPMFSGLCLLLINRVFSIAINN